MAASAPHSYKSLGKSVVKKDARLKATGQARYANDIKHIRHGCLCGRILRSPHAHARIVSIDTSSAAALPGVYAVVTAADAARTRIGRFLRDRTVLASDKVRYIGEPVAAVAAIDEATAERALSLIKVEYEPLPEVFSPDQASAPDAPIIHEDLASYDDPHSSQRCGNQRNAITIERGDVATAFAKADIVVEGTFVTQPVHQGFIEPKACVASLESNGKLTIWSTNKSPFLNREMICRGLGLPLSQVRVITPTVGGDFGGKGAPTIEPICALLALKSGRAVKIVLSTQEELATNFVRHPATIKLKVAADKQGRLLGIEGEVVYNCGAYCDGILGMAHSCVYLQGPYNVANVRLKGLSVFTNSVPAGHVRAPGAPQTLFAIESLIDELAERLHIDPFEIRRRNALAPGDVPPDGRGRMGPNGLMETIEKVANYAAREMRKQGKNWGLGVACGAWHVTLTEDVNPTKCVVKLNEDGSATLLTGLADNGAGQHVLLSQVVAETLGLDPSEVAVIGGDTEITPYDSGPGGSRATVRVCQAARFAAEDARKQILEIAASRLEANVDDLEISHRRVYVKGVPDRAIELATLAQAALRSPRGAIVGIGSLEREQWLAAAKGHAGTVDEASFCTHAALVEVDPETGQVTVHKYIAAQDVGTALNPLNVVGQIQGSVVAGLGYALSEELIVHKGRVVNPTYTDYHLPGADMAPNVVAILVEQPSALGPFGARGVGETSITPVAAAIANAVYDAIGVRIRELPLTPQKIVKAFREQQAVTQHR